MAGGVGWRRRLLMNNPISTWKETSGTSGGSIQQWRSMGGHFVSCMSGFSSSQSSTVTAGHCSSVGMKPRPPLSSPITKIEGQKFARIFLRSKPSLDPLVGLVCTAGHELQRGGKSAHVHCQEGNSDLLTVVPCQFVCIPWAFSSRWTSYFKMFTCYWCSASHVLLLPLC